MIFLIQFYCRAIQEGVGFHIQFLLINTLLVMLARIMKIVEPPLVITNLFDWESIVRSYLLCLIYYLLYIDTWIPGI